MIQSQHHYQRYQRFIDALKGQSVDGYAEVHHIVPRSLGGSDDAGNLIRLTARQHYVAHWMLARAIGGSASRSFFMMSNFGKYGRVNSATYEIGRKEYSKLVGEQMRGRVMPPVSDETRAKQRQAKLGRKLTPEHIEKIRLAVLGRKMGPEFAAKVSEAKRGRGNSRNGFVTSEETKRKMAEANRNRPIIVCPHCNKSVKDHGGAKRWHFDKCKERKAA
jgi:hypothetical protein